MIAAWKSDIGKVRRRNEDFVLADEKRGMFFLADGMGGLPGGDVASSLAVRTAYRYILERITDCYGEAVERILVEALASAHAAVSRKGIAEPDLAEMGTTLDIVFLRGGTAWVGHVGDSRLYLFSHGELLQVTTDDNLASALARQGVSPDEIPAHARHVLTQAVGCSDKVAPESRVVGLGDGDILLMCSDGLTGMTPDNIISQIIGEHCSDLWKAADLLVAEAIARGGLDNVSVILIDPQVSISHGEQYLPK